MKYNDTVKFKDWDDLEREFGVDYDGDIETSYAVTSEMRPFCGKVFRIIDVEVDDDEGLESLLVCPYKRRGEKWEDIVGEYSYSSDMFEQVDSRSISLYKHKLGEL